MAEQVEVAEVAEVVAVTVVVAVATAALVFPIKGNEWCEAPKADRIQVAEGCTEKRNANPPSCLGSAWTSSNAPGRNYQLI